MLTRAHPRLCCLDNRRQRFSKGTFFDNRRLRCFFITDFRRSAIMHAAPLCKQLSIIQSIAIGNARVPLQKDQACFIYKAAGGSKGYCSAAKLRKASWESYFLLTGFLLFSLFFRASIWACSASLTISIPASLCDMHGWLSTFIAVAYSENCCIWHLKPSLLLATYLQCHSLFFSSGSDNNILW